jgi:hypothetical protein
MVIVTSNEVSHAWAEGGEISQLGSAVKLDSVENVYFICGMC